MFARTARLLLLILSLAAQAAITRAVHWETIVETLWALSR
jgi:hypothetical protein